MLSRIMLIIGGAVVLALFAALLAPLFVDWTNFRQDFEREASRIMGREVVVHGSVDARILPFPSVTLNDVRVGGEADGEAMVEVARFSMDAELAPFLSGEALIFDMRVEEPKVRVRLHSDGTLDWARGRRSDIPARTVVLENVTVTGGEVEFVDEQTGRTRRLTGLDARLSARSLSGPWRIDGRGALDGEAGAFQLSSGQADARGALSLRARIVPDRLPYSAELDGELKVVDFKPRYDGAFMLGRKITEDGAAAGAPIRVVGAFELSNERLRIGEYRLEAGPREDPYVVTGEATLDTGREPEFLLIADGQQIDVSRIGNNGETGKTGRDPTLSARHRLQALLSIAADIPIPQVPGRASLKLPAVVVGDTTVREIRLDLRPDGAGWLVDRAEALLPGRTRLEAGGRLTLGEERTFVGDLLVASNQPSGLAAWLAGSVDPEIRTLGTAGFSARVDLSDELQRFENLELAVGPATLAGRIERQSRAGTKPGLSIELRGDSVDLQSLRALTGLVAGDASLDGVLEHQIALDLRAGRFSAFGEEAEEVVAVLSLDGGTLQIDRLDIGALAGAAIRLNGAAGGDPLSPLAGLRLSLEAEAMRPVAELLARHLPAHPLLARFVDNAGFYDEADLSLAATLPGDSGDRAAATLSGAVNGGRIDLRLEAGTLESLLAGRDFSLDATLAHPQTTVLAGQAGLDPLPFDTGADGTVAVRLAQPADGPADLSASFTAGQTALSAQGHAELSAERFLAGALRLSAESDDIEPYLLMNGVVLPQSGAGLPLRLSADLAIAPETIRISAIEGTADRNGFSGELTLDRSAAIARGEGRLSFDTVDLAWLAETVIGPVEDVAEGGLNAEPLGNAAWGAADFSVAVEARQFWPGIYGPVEELKTALVWRGGDFALEDIAGSWLGGRLSGRLKVANAEENGLFEARLGLSGGDLSQILWADGEGPLTEGRVDMTLAIDASGKSLAAMVAGASGSGEAVIEGLGVRGVNTGAFATILADADAIEGDITPERVAAIAESRIMNGQARLDTVRIPFSVVSGRVRAQNVTAGDAAASISGDAEIDVSEGLITASAGLRFDAGDEALAGADPEVTLSFAGLLGTPGATLDAQGLANYLSLRRFETERRRVEMLQSNVLEKQRLRREAALYRTREETRRALAEAARLQAEEEARRRAQARERAERLRAEQEAALAAERARREEQEAERRRLEAEEQARREARDGVTRGEELPPVDTGRALNFETLPGVN